MTHHKHLILLVNYGDPVSAKKKMIIIRNNGHIQIGDEHLLSRQEHTFKADERKILLVETHHFRRDEVLILKANKIYLIIWPEEVEVIPILNWTHVRDWLSTNLYDLIEIRLDDLVHYAPLSEANSHLNLKAKWTEVFSFTINSDSTTPHKQADEPFSPPLDTNAGWPTMKIPKKKED